MKYSDIGWYRRETTRALRVRHILLLIIPTVAIHLNVLDAWWRGDDPQLLLHAIRNTPIETLFSPSRYRTLQSVSLTPLLSISFDFDYLLFGLNPSAFYVHQLVALVACVLTSFMLVEKICDYRSAMFTAVLVGIGPASAFMSEFLMLRHYVEGTALALAALACWKSGEQHRARIGRDTTVAVLYLCSMLAKEVFTTIPVLFLADALLSRVPPKQLVRRIAPSAVLAGVYLAWRVHVLGSLGGYGAALSGPVEGLGSLSASLIRLLGSFLLPFVVLAALALIMGLVKHPRATTVIVFATLISVGLPLVGVSGMTEARYALVPFMAFTILCGIAIPLLPERAQFAGAAALAAMILLSSLQTHRMLEQSQARSEAEGLYVWRAHASSNTLLAASPGWYLSGLADLRELEKAGNGPPFVLSIHGLSAEPLDLKQVVNFGEDGSGPHSLRPDLVDVVVADRSRRDDSIALNVNASMERFALTWSLGPEDGSRFVWLTAPSYDDYEVPPQGSFRIPEAGEIQYFQIRRDLPDGRWTISPPLTLPRNGESITWSAPQ